MAQLVLPALKVPLAQTVLTEQLVLKVLQVPQVLLVQTE
jgi:hypothetical protein